MVLWDFTIQTDHAIEARRPDLIVTVDFPIPHDSRIEQKENEKVYKYQDVETELHKYEKSSLHIHRGIRNTTKKHEKENKRARNLEIN